MKEGKRKKERKKEQLKIKLYLRSINIYLKKLRKNLNQGIIRGN